MVTLTYFIKFFIGIVIGVKISDWIWDKYTVPKLDREIDEMNRKFFNQ